IFQNALRGRDLASAYTAAGALADVRFVPLGSVDLLLDVFGEMSAPRDVEPMTRILGSLARIGDEHAIPVLRAAMVHTTPAVAEAAAAALARITGVEVGASSDNPPERRIDWERLSGYGSRPRLQLITDRGTILVALDPGQAPQTCETILRFAEEGAYDGVPFHRVVTNFVIQGGDFERADGFGGPGFAIRSEFTRIPYRRGVIGMASGGKDTEGSQFFITHSPQPHLDGRYTAFGQVVRGMSVVDSIIQGDRVIAAEVIRGG
ncbi:peptidylprolyl isomerase, partial [Gemmatimonadota bacterium]